MISDFALERLINTAQAGEGTNMPPRQFGDIRVPIVSNLRILKVDNYFGGTTFTLGWDDPEFGNITVGQYNIFVSGIDGVTQPQGPYSARVSPAIVRISTRIPSNLVFTVQTQLTNGMTSPLEVSTSVASATLAPVISAANLPASGVTAGTYGTSTAVGQFTVTAEGLISAAVNVPISGVSYPYAAKTANYTIAVTDYLVNCTANTFTITLPTALGIAGQQFQIKNSGTGIITINTTSAQVIDDQASGAITLVQWEALYVASDGANWLIL
tara:strand:- start:344 stop:1153 length:810 start_codon:yes stop_codon:yes gene_type:complete